MLINKIFYEKKNYQLFFFYLLLLIAIFPSFREFKIYSPLLSIFVILNFILILDKKIFSIQNYLGFFITLFFLETILILLRSVEYLDDYNISNGGSRLLLNPLIFLFILAFIREKKSFENFAFFLLFAIFIGSLSILYQLFFGELDFLNRVTSSRMGLSRYSSFLGSLTIYGVASATALVICNFLKNINFFFRLFFLISLNLACLVSLGKGGIMNAFLIFIISIFFSKIEKKYTINLILTLSLVFIYFFNLKFHDYLNATFWQIFGSYNQNQNIQIFAYGSLFSQILERLMGWNYIFHHTDIKSYLIGYGLIGGQGTFGMSDSFTGTAHNQFWDIISIGGIFYWLTIVLIIVFCLIHLLKKYDDNIYQVYFWIVIFSILNMTFHNGYLFNPSSGLGFWSAVALCYKSTLEYKI